MSPMLARVGACAWRLLLLAMLGGAACAHAHERDYYFKRIDSSQGLAQNSVAVIFQDSRGYLWLGTQGGLHRYDGYHLRHYRHNPSREDSLPDNLITALADAGEGRLWVGTNAGTLSLFDPDRDHVVPLPPDWTRQLADVAALAGGGQGVLLVGARNGIFALDWQQRTLRQLWKSSPLGRPRAFALCADGGRYALVGGDQVLALGHDAASSHVLARGLDGTRSLLCTRDGHLLLGSTHGLQRIDRHSGAVTWLWPHADEPALASTNVRAMAQDHAGRLWLAVNGVGLVRLDQNASTARVLRPQRDIPGTLPEAAIATLYVDRSGLLWAGGTTRGAAYMDPAGTPFRYIFTDQDHDPAANNNVRAFHQNADGSFWISYYGSGPRHYDPRHDRFEDYSDALAGVLAPGQMRNLRVYAMVDDGHGAFRLASNHGLIRFDPKRRTASMLYPVRADARGGPGVRSLLHARDGSWWLGKLGGGVVHLRQGQPPRQFLHEPGDPDSLGDNFVLSLVQDRDGMIWAGTASGLSRIDPSSGRIRTFRETPGRHDSLTGRVVTDLYLDDSGSLWVGTQTGLAHLLEVDSAGAHFRRYLASGGLPDATVYCILQDADKQLWLSTNLGVLRLDPVTERVQSFTPRDGLQGLEYNSGACLRASDGSLLFGGVNGFDRVQPSAVHSSDFVPPVAITAVAVGKHESPPPADGALRMPKSARVVRFDFAAMDFAAPQSNRFHYRLVGFDRDWIDAGTRHSVSYTNLDAGDYRFEVRGSNHAGHFGTATTVLELHVLPPWWQSLPARIAYVLAAVLLLLAAYGVFRARRADKRRHQRQLREREERLNMALWGSGDEFWDLDLRSGRVYRIGGEQMLGSGAATELSLEDWRNYVVHPDDLPRLQQTMKDHIDGDTDHFESEYRLRNTAGEWVWVLARGKLVERDSDGHALRISGTARDVSQRRDAEHDRRIAAEVIRSMAEAVTVTDLEFRFCSVNPAFTRMTGYGNEEIAGCDAELLNCRQHAPDGYSQLREGVTARGHWRGELWQRRKDGSEFLSWVEIREVCDATGARTHYVAVLADITDRKRAEQELRYLANYDMLTGLPNRTLLSERLGDAIMRARRSHHKLAVLYVDLDRFKHVNDSMGHGTGDRLLKAAGARLRHCLRERDMVARVGGDEFTLVLENASSVAEIEATAQRVIDAFATPLLLDTRQEILISPSIGIAAYPQHGNTATDLLKSADTAMYQAKEHGRNTWTLYTEAMDAAAHLRARMSGALRRALSRGEMNVVYQPKLDLANDRIIGVEALLRWHSAALGNVPPAVFVPLAEETGMIVEIGEFVLHRACSDLAAWRRAGVGELGIAVNLSMVQLQRSQLPQTLRSALAEHAIPAACLELELTESTVMGNVEQSVRTLGELKSIGISLAIDDFGTGYSSLAYLKRLPIDTLKIDRTFISEVTSDPDDASITSTIVSMAHSLGLNVVAEGVETDAQMEFLRGHGCDLIQGNWLAAAMAPAECLRFCLARQGIDVT